MHRVVNYVDSNLEVISWKSEPNFDVDMELNASETDSNSGPRTDNELGNAFQMSATSVSSNIYLVCHPYHTGHVAAALEGLPCSTVIYSGKKSFNARIFL